MNSRHLTKVSDDPSDLEVLIPNHLLLLQPGPSLPPGIFVKPICIVDVDGGKLNIYQMFFGAAG